MGNIPPTLKAVDLSNSGEFMTAVHKNKGLLEASYEMVRDWFFSMKRLSQDHLPTPEEWKDRVPDAEVRGVLMLLFALDPELSALSRPKQQMLFADHAHDRTMMLGVNPTHGEVGAGERTMILGAGTPPSTPASSPFNPEHTIIIGTNGT